MTTTFPELSTTHPTAPEAVPLRGRAALRGEVRARSTLTGPEVDEMFALFDEFYLSADRSCFDVDLRDKDWVLLLTHPRRGICGFSTMKEYETEWNGSSLLIFFSGDTIVHSSCWGSPQMSRLWTRHMFERAAERPALRAFWFLIASGHKTYRLLPLFFKSFVPARHDDAGELSAILAQLAEARFGTGFDRENGVIRLEHPTPLRPGVADVTSRERKNPHVAFFLEKNPGHTSGEELAGLAELDTRNLTSAGLKMLGPWCQRASEIPRGTLG